MAWLPVLTFVAYPYMKRFTWLCHLWLGLCLGLAPAGAWVAVAADEHGWAAITGMHSTNSAFLWMPTILPLSLGVALWIAAFDLNYARMDEENDKAQGIRSFPSRFGPKATSATTVVLTLVWCMLFSIANPVDNLWFVAASVTMAVANVAVVLRMDHWRDFQRMLFRTSMLTGWVLLVALFIAYAVDVPVLD